MFIHSTFWGSCHSSLACFPIPSLESMSWVFWLCWVFALAFAGLITLLWHLYRQPMRFNVVTRLLETGNNLFFFFFSAFGFWLLPLNVPQHPLSPFLLSRLIPTVFHQCDICIIHCLVLCKLYSLAFLASFFYINHKFIEERFLETDKIFIHLESFAKCHCQSTSWGLKALWAEVINNSGKKRGRGIGQLIRLMTWRLQVRIMSPH